MHVTNVQSSMITIEELSNYYIERLLSPSLPELMYSVLLGRLEIWYLSVLSLESADYSFGFFVDSCCLPPKIFLVKERKSKTFDELRGC